MRRALPVLTALIVLAYYLFFVWPSLRMYFDNDDMMNLYLAWSKPVFDSYRPLGALFYRSLFALFGFNPLPFRIACLALGALNIGLCGWFVFLATESRRIAALAALIFAFHNELIEVWYRTAAVYDLLCFTFFYLAACLYMQRPHIQPGKRTVARNLLVLVCFLSALAAKENAVALPVILLVWDLTRNNRVERPWLPLLCGLIDIPYLWSKTHGANALTAIAPYRSEFTLTRFSHTWALYLNYVFLQHNRILPWMSILILAALLAPALRWKKLLPAWAVLFFPVLPVAFLEYRGGFVLYTLSGLGALRRNRAGCVAEPGEATPHGAGLPDLCNRGMALGQAESP